MSRSRVVVVTGVSSGMGRAIAKTLAGRGFAVYGTSRDLSYAMPIVLKPARSQRPAW